MEIKDLHARQGDVELVVEVIEKSQPRTFEKSGKQGRVCNTKVKDASGTISLTLWNEDIDKVDVGDKLKISKGYVGEWQGELQVTAGKFGKIEVVEKGVPKEHDHQKEVEQAEKLEEKEMSPEEPEKDFDVEEEFF